MLKYAHYRNVPKDGTILGDFECTLDPENLEDGCVTENRGSGK